MDQIQAIMGNLNSMERTFEPMTPEHWEKYKAEDYNKKPGTLNEQDGYDCPTCKNKGDIWKAVQDERSWWSQTSIECKCMKIRRTIRRMQRSGLKNIIRDYTFERYNATAPWQQTVKEAAMEYASNPSGWFFMGGQPGCGKTHICTAICREFLLAGREVRYMLWREDANQLKQVVTDFEQYKDLIEPYKSVDVLYIDDLFKTGKDDAGAKQKPKQGDINVAFEILNSRYNDPVKLTIISSECTMDDLLEIDEAVGSRIFERAKVFSMKPDRSKNYRLKGAIEL